MNLFQCLDCGLVAEPTIHGLCSRCNSQALVTFAVGIALGMIAGAIMALWASA